MIHNDRLDGNSAAIGINYLIRELYNPPLLTSIVADDVIDS